MQKYPGDPSPWQLGSGLPNAATRSAETVIGVNRIHGGMAGEEG